MILQRASNGSFKTVGRSALPYKAGSSLLRLLAVLSVLVAVACSRQVAPAPPPPAAAPLPQVSGTLQLDDAALSQPVRIVRDRWGVPHIYAQNESDLFFAQGFVQAQDRLFQMDLWRRSAQGRLSEVLGLNFVERDAATRRVQYRGDMNAEWASYGPGVKAIAEAFVRGVNAWVAIARQQVPEEFLLAGWMPERWTAEDVLNRTDAFLSSDAELDIFRARLVAAVGERTADAFFPIATPYRIPAGLDINAVSYVAGDALRRVGTAPFFLGLAGPVIAPATPGAGSNAWVVNGARSATGAALLANDPHRAFAHPSLRYLVHLNAPGWNVIGAASPWLPGVVIGHNDRVAWGITAAAADVVDVYIERVNPSNPHQVQYRGAWVDTKILPDPIVMKGQDKPFPFEREFTPNGAIFAADTDRHLAFSVRWSGSEPGAAGELAALGLDRARSSAELRASLSRWKLPVVDVIYADVDGVIGRQVAGLAPVRLGWDGALPAPGWTGTYAWRGWQHLDNRPQPLSPSAGGLLISANQHPARTSRLGELFAGTRAYTTGDFKKLQHDTTAWNAEQLVPLLAAVRADRDDVEASRQQLIRWDRRVTADSTAAVLYVFWEEALARHLAESRMRSDLVDEYVARAGVSVSALLKPSAAWFDGNVTGARDRVLLDALAAATERARRAAPADQRAPALLPWGRLHTLTFRHPLAISPAARSRFNIGPFAQAGYAGTVLSTYPAEDVSGGASFREIIDLAAWDRSVATNAPGQSGAPGPRHFADLAKPWAAGEYFPLAFTDAAVQANTESVLILQPR